MMVDMALSCLLLGENNDASLIMKLKFFLPNLWSVSKRL